MLEAFNTFNLLNLADNLSNYIQFENRNASGSAYFYGLLHAVKNHLIIKIKYLKYEMDEISNRELEPYLLKEFKNRWYIIATDKKDNITKTFALDRIQDLEITRRKFELTSNFSHFELFQNCFGIISPNDGQPEEIVLSFEPHQGKYIKSCPIHISQEVVVNNNAETRIKLHLYVTHDLVMELLSYGETMKVIKPKRLIKIIRESARKTLNNHR
jgi:predicted DNA-binding transcriptional regulator YafY